MGFFFLLAFSFSSVATSYFLLLFCLLTAARSLFSKLLLFIWFFHLFVSFLGLNFETIFFFFFFFFLPQLQLTSRGLCSPGRACTGLCRCLPLLKSLAESADRKREREAGRKAATPAMNFREPSRHAAAPPPLPSSPPTPSGGRSSDLCPEI